MITLNICRGSNILQILPYVSDHRPITSFAARLLNKLVGERDWSAQEISHILLKIPQQKSTRQCMVLDCRPDSAQDATSSLMMMKQEKTWW